MAEALNLKPCPFCGETEHLYPMMRHVEAAAPYGIDCVGCGVEFIPREGFDVIAAWNRRSEPEALRLLGEVEKALEEIARIRTELRGDFSLSSKQSDIARSALDKLRKGMG